MPRPTIRIIVGAAVLDVALVLAFVIIGRSSHAEGESPAGIFTTFWPFGVGLIVGWLGARAWRRPAAVVRTGIIVWLATVVVGMLLRVATGQGVEVSFVVVAGVVLAVFLVGWRGIARVIARRRGPGHRDTRAMTGSAVR